jgi:hypothetical protein
MMDMKLAKVLTWLHKNMEGEVSMTEDTISTVCNDVADALRKQFASSTNRREFSARPSNLGRPLCQLQMEKKGASGVQPSYNFILRMMVGDIVEAVLKGVIKESGIEGYESSQKLSTQLGKHTITGEADLTFDGKVDDIKSCSDYAFRNKFVSWPSLKDRDSFGYVTQLHVYASATGKPAGGIWALNVATGELNRIESTDTDADVKDILAEAEKKVEALTSDAPFKRCFDDEPETFNRILTGNRKLGMECSWCKYRFSCWPNLQERESVFSKAKSKPIVAYTELNNMEGEASSF